MHTSATKPYSHKLYLLPNPERDKFAANLIQTMYRINISIKNLHRKQIYPCRTFNSINFLHVIVWGSVPRPIAIYYLYTSWLKDSLSARLQERRRQRWGLVGACAIGGLIRWVGVGAGANGNGYSL